MNPSRRQAIAGFGALAGTSLFPRVALAKAETDRRLVLVILRGAMDGLHALPPLGDPDYLKLRPSIGLGLDQDGRTALPLTADFGLHPALSPLLPLYRAGEVSFIPAVGTRYTRRSHFEAQDLLEGGGLRPYARRSGWLNRALVAQSGTQARAGLAVGATVPLALQGPAPVRALGTSRLPDATEDFLFRAEGLFAADPLFRSAFAQAQADMTEQMALGLSDRNRRSVAETVRSVTTLMREADGPRVAVLESGGWDTHYAQLRRLNAQFRDVSELITALKAGMGAQWSQTAVVIVSEFGRTARENGSGGTDHGTGGLAIVAGGRLGRMRIGGQWPGLSAAALVEDRDLRATTPMESVFMAALTHHLGLSETLMRDHVFTEHGDIDPLEGLFLA